MCVFDATAILPYCRLDANKIPGGLVDYQAYQAPCLSGEQIGALFRPDPATNALPEKAKQSMAWVLVVISKEHVPPYVLAMHEHRGGTSDVVQEWEDKAIAITGKLRINMKGFG